MPEGKAGLIEQVLIIDNTLLDYPGCRQGGDYILLC